MKPASPEVLDQLILEHDTIVRDGGGDGCLWMRVEPIQTLGSQLYVDRQSAGFTGGTDVEMLHVTCKPIRDKRWYGEALVPYWISDANTRGNTSFFAYLNFLLRRAQNALGAKFHDEIDSLLLSEQQSYQIRLFR